eukprot:symbB.v1.2.037422.t1/scaffold5521.1/size26208/2
MPAIPGPSIPCTGKSKTALTEYAENVRKTTMRSIPEVVSPKFPMYVIPLDTVLHMTKVIGHQELLRDGKLRHFDPAEGKAMFISHQWASDQHPDPDGEQLKVFIEAMSHLLKGNIEAVPNAYTECINTLMRWPQFAGSALSEGHDPRPLVAQQYSFVLFVESRRQVTVGSAWQSLFRAPGDGQFTVPSDRDLVGSMLQSMLRWKLEGLLRRGDFTAYRFLLNQQHFRLRKCNVAPVPSLVLLEPEILSDHADALVQQFLFQNGFNSICDRDKAGWSPFCYAAVNGNPELLIAMLRKRADPNDYVRKPYRAAYLDKDSSALYICSRFGNHESMRILLENRANPSKADSLGFTPLCAVAVFADNVEGARLLLEARADAFAENGFGQSAFTVAATHGAIKILKELLKTPACAHTSRSGILHEAVFLCHAPVEHISVLLEIGCDINEPLHYRKVPNRLLFGFFTLRHFVKRKSAMSTLAYHHAGATPLMMSILANYYAACHLLIHAKARLDLQNSRHQTAFDLAIKTCAPDFLLQELWQHGAANYASEASRSSIWYNYSNSKRMRRHFWVDSQKVELCWSKSKAEGEEPQMMSLRDSVGLIYGPMTTTFQRCEQLEDLPSTCFSILFSDRTLDLAVPSRVESWFLGFQYYLLGRSNCVSCITEVRDGAVKLDDWRRRLFMTAAADL